MDLRTDWIGVGVTANEIIINLISDLIFVVLSIFLAWVYYHITNREKIKAFFGVKQSRKIVVYLSNIRVIQGGSIGIDNVKRSYSGSTGAFGEIFEANNFKNRLNFILPSHTAYPEFISKLLLLDIEIQISLSPLRKDELESDSSIVAVGSPAYNHASLYIENDLHSMGKFILGSQQLSNPNSFTASPDVTSQPHYSGGTIAPYPQRSSFRAQGNSNANRLENSNPGRVDTITPSIVIDGVAPFCNSLTGFVERIIDKQNNRSVFYVAGLSELATRGAFFYLTKNWARLEKKYKSDQPFLLMLSFDYENYKNATLLFEKS